MKKRKQPIKYFIVIITAAVLFLCIYGIPLKGIKTEVNVRGTNESGTFTGTWSLAGGKRGTFTADEGWTFEGIINPDGGLHEGELTNFPVPSEWREDGAADLPEFYTGTVEEGSLITAVPDAS